MVKYIKRATLPSINNHNETCNICIKCGVNTFTYGKEQTTRYQHQYCVVVSTLRLASFPLQDLFAAYWPCVLYHSYAEQYPHLILVREYVFPSQFRPCIC